MNRRHQKTGIYILLGILPFRSVAEVDIITNKGCYDDTFLVSSMQQIQDAGVRAGVVSEKVSAN